MTTNEARHTIEQIGYGREFTVIFTKKDGTQRKMRCMMEAPTGEIKPCRRHINPDVVPVQDLDKGAWRSFRLDSVLSITI